MRLDWAKEGIPMLSGRFGVIFGGDGGVGGIREEDRDVNQRKDRMRVPNVRI